jgi:Uma2 family endonuclease
MVMTVEDIYLPITLSVPDLSDEAFAEFCEQYADYRLEYTAEGELVIMPPTDLETGVRNSYLVMELGIWTRRRGWGYVADSSTGFRLPNGARRSPDAAWMSPEQAHARPSCPEFVIELRSPSDRMRALKNKMQEWIANGAQLGWLLDPVNRTVWIYRAGHAEPEERIGLSQIEGEGPVAGFVLDLTPVWNGLN